jgi:hypothetical protein
MAFKIKNIKENWNRTQQDPYFSIKFQYKVQRMFVYFIMAIIGITFLMLVINFKSTGPMGIVVRVFMIFIGIFMLYQIYAKTILPTKKIIQHYESSPTAISSKVIDVGKEVDDILNKFDKDGKRVK